MRANGMELKRMRLVQHDICSRPFLVLLEGRKGGRPGLNMLPTLIMENGGAPTPEAREIYGHFGEVKEV